MLHNGVAWTVRPSLHGDGKYEPAVVHPVYGYTSVYGVCVPLAEAVTLAKGACVRMWKVFDLLNK